MKPNSGNPNRLVAVGIVAIIAAITLSGVVLHMKSATAPIPPGTANRILVEKSKRTMTLFCDGKMVRTYSISLGPNPEGHKEQEGDGRTPEGIYWIDWRNPQSKFHLSLHVSYPNAEDMQSAAAKGVSPGGDIMIHGLPNGVDDRERQRFATDWTAGCVAVSNAGIEEIWSAVPDGAEVEIRP